MKRFLLAALAAASLFATVPAQAQAQLYERQPDGSFVPVGVAPVVPAYATIKCYQPSVFGGYWRYFNVPPGAGCPTEYVPPAGIFIGVGIGSGWHSGYRRHW